MLMENVQEELQCIVEDVHVGDFMKAVALQQFPRGRS